MDAQHPDHPRSRYGDKPRVRFSEAFEAWRAARRSLGAYHPDTHHLGKLHSVHVGLFTRLDQEPKPLPALPWSAA